MELHKQEIIDEISQNYYPLSKECMSELSEKSTLIKVAKGSQLVREGQYAQKLYYIYKGCSRAYYLEEGKDISDWFAFEGYFISPIISFFQDVASPHFIEVLEDSVLLEVSRQETEFLMEKYIEFERLSRIVITKTMLRLQERVVALQFQTARQKYETLVSSRPDILQRVPLTHIASYIGITLETLSRIRRPNLT